ncbi:unnamed protein product [Paramecium pentaurelia]|uniref:Uncharacterized protein n=1 Tax=Paramecium pentaurelia TaxID=43138 RepID=A0A8S1VZW8_9CILI|nr:unnamed protein product [Paramecium pentaurelia]
MAKNQQQQIKMLIFEKLWMRKLDIVKFCMKIKK